MESAIPEVKEYGNILWNNLPYTGLYMESAYAGQTYKQFTLPQSTKMSLVGSPLPVVNNGVNKNLQLIGFSTDTTDGPFTVDTNGRLVPFSPWLIYKIKWRVSSKCTIGFYTPNYLSDVTEEQGRRSVLLINDDQPSIFKGRCGCFKTSYMGQLFIITDKKVAVEMLVEVSAPECISFPLLQLFKPKTYELPNGSTYAYETKVSKVNREITFIPTRPYINLTLEMIDFLIRTSVLLNFSPITPMSLMVKNDTPLTLREVNTKSSGARVESNPGDAEVLFFFDFNEDNIAVINNVPGYKATQGPDGTYSVLNFPVTTDLSGPNVFIEFTVVISNTDLRRNTIQAFSFGRTDEDGFQLYVTNRVLMEYSEENKTLTGEGLVAFPRQHGSVEMNTQAVIDDIGLNPQIVFKEMKISFTT